MSGPSIPGLGSTYRFTVEDAPAASDIEVLLHAMDAFNDKQWPQPPPWTSPLGIFVGDGAQIVAGLAGRTSRGWLFISHVWVCDELRGRGVGRELVAQAEARARERGCHSAWLDTFSFQAPGFYQKLGYEEFGRLDYPPDHYRHFMRKRLIPSE